MRHRAIIMLITLISCTGNDDKEHIPQNIISKEEMVPLIVDMQLIEGANSTKFFQGDTGRTNYALMYNTIFEKHNVEKRQFDSSMSYYTLHSVEMEAIYDQVIEELMKIEATETASDQ